MDQPTNDASTVGLLLDVKELHARYGDSDVLHGVSFDIEPGEVVTLLGRNGAGKTTVLRAIMRILRSVSGSIKFGQHELTRLSVHQVGQLGIAYCPEERGIYSSLTVEENLMLPPKLHDGGLRMEEILSLFPNLKERLRHQGTKLSGGEQQMLAIGRILRTGATLLLLDEPTEGLSPLIVKQIRRVIEKLKREKFTILLVEQNFHFAAHLADRHYIVDRGRVVDIIPEASVGARMNDISRYLGV